MEMFSYEALAFWGLTIIRVGIGLIFAGHGYLKLKGGKNTWMWLGEQMSNLGITFLPLWWGIAAMSIELMGGSFLVIGLYTRLVSFFLAGVMVVALIHHLKKGDNFQYSSFPLSQLVIFIGLLIAGSGPFSLDYLL